MKPLHEAGLLLIFAVGVRALSAAALGGGAPFGPDGTGVEAAVHLGGHLYPFHVELIRLIGSARLLSVISGGLCAPLLWAIGHRLGLGGAGGWLWAAAPLGVYTGALSAGDAPALCVVLLGVLLATGGRRSGLLGGALAMASVAVKPVALPALGLLLLRPWGLVGATLSLPWTSGWLGPLVAPKVQGGLLGSWWVSSAGRPPEGLGGVLSLGLTGLEALVAAPQGLSQPERYREGGYIRRLPEDPWGNPYQYAYPGRARAFDVYSLGADNAPGGEGLDADIGNWN
jgi:hypothetical protein